MHSKEDFFFIININAIFYKYQHNSISKFVKDNFHFLLFQEKSPGVFPLIDKKKKNVVLTDFKMHRLIWTKEVWCRLEDAEKQF